jgi:flagellar motor protein MotB
MTAPQQQPTRDQLAHYLCVQAVLPSAASALKQCQLNVSHTVNSSAWETSHWIQVVLQLSSQPFAPTLALVACAIWVQHLLDQQSQVGQQLQLLETVGVASRRLDAAATPLQQQQWLQEQQHKLHVLLQWQQQEQQQQQLQWLQQQQQLQWLQQQQQQLQWLQQQQQQLQWLLQQQEQLAADILQEQQHAQELYDEEMQRRTAKAAETKQYGSLSYSCIRDSTLVCWSQFTPSQMEGFLRVYEQKGRVRSASTRGTAGHKDMPPADAASRARRIYASMRVSAAKASPAHFSEAGEGLAALAEAAAASDPAVAALLSLWMAAVGVAATLEEEEEEDDVVAIGMVQRWLIGEYTALGGCQCSRNKVAVVAREGVRGVGHPCLAARQLHLSIGSFV